MNAHRLLQRPESLRAVDRPAAVVAATARRLLKKTGTSRALRGAWLGHPLHPILIAVPIGAWICSAIFDVKPADRDVARKLITVGLAAMPPTILLGLADYSELDQRQRRVGVVHAVANAVAGACYATSYRCRSHGAHGSGVLFSLLGLTAVGVGGALGGHLSYAQGAGVYRWQSSEENNRGE